MRCARSYVARGDSDRGRLGGRTSPTAVDRSVDKMVENLVDNSPCHRTNMRSNLFRDTWEVERDYQSGNRPRRSTSQRPIAPRGSSNQLQGRFDERTVLAPSRAFHVWALEVRLAAPTLANALGYGVTHSRCSH